MPSAGAWEKTKTGGKKGFDKAYALVDKLGAPINRLSNKLGAEAFWPTTLDKESDKAARILRSFCKDGFYHEEEIPNEDGPKKKQRVLKKIPSSVIARARGLAIFTTMRSGLWISGAGGSGVLVARQENGTWSPPSGIMLHTAGLGFLVGVDIYDCVVVINTQEGLDAFSKVRCTLGGEISAVAGPVGAGGVLESEVHKRQAPIFTYLKSRGFYAGVQIDGTIVIERTDENERFYGERIGVGDILTGKVRHPPFETKMLIETIKAAQGDRDFNEDALPQGLAPGDVSIEKDLGVFGIPDADDPDPFGVLALENAGMEIREAGTRSRPSSEQFEYRPSPTSPTFNTFHRRSMRSIGSRDSYRGSIDRGILMEDKGVQTDDLPDPPSKGPIQDRTDEYIQTNAASDDTNGYLENPSDRIKDIEIAVEAKPAATAISSSLTTSKTENCDSDTIPKLEVDVESNYSEHLPEEENGDHDSPLRSDVNFHDESAEANTVQYGAIQQPFQVLKNAKVVAIPKRVPPKLPPRNPNRQTANISIDTGHHRDTRVSQEPFTSDENFINGTIHKETQQEASEVLKPDDASSPSFHDDSALPSLQLYDRRNFQVSDSSPHASTDKPIHLTDEDSSILPKEEDAFYSTPSSPIVAVSPSLSLVQKAAKI